MTDSSCLEPINRKTRWRLRKDAQRTERPWCWPLPRLAHHEPVALRADDCERWLSVDVGYPGVDLDAMLFVPVYVALSVHGFRRAARCALDNHVAASALGYRARCRRRRRRHRHSDTTATGKKRRPPDIRATPTVIAHRPLANQKPASQAATLSDNAAEH